MGHPDRWWRRGGGVAGRQTWPVSRPGLSPRSPLSRSYRCSSRPLVCSAPTPALGIHRRGAVERRRRRGERGKRERRTDESEPNALRFVPTMSHANGMLAPRLFGLQSFIFIVLYRSLRLMTVPRDVDKSKRKSSSQLKPYGNPSSCRLSTNDSFLNLSHSRLP